MQISAVTAAGVRVSAMLQLFSTLGNIQTFDQYHDGVFEIKHTNHFLFVSNIKSATISSGADLNCTSSFKVYSDYWYSVEAEDNN